MVEGLEATEALAGFAEAQGLARLALDDGYGPQTRWEPQPVPVTLGGVTVPLPHGAFLQAPAEGEAALVAAALELVGPARIVADLFAGLCTFAQYLDGLVLAGGGRRAAVQSRNTNSAGTTNQGNGVALGME